MAIYLISQAKTGLSSLALKRQLGVSYATACASHHKINHAMTARDACHQLSGAVQVDDAYLGGEHPGGKPILGNLKTSLHGAHHSLGWAKHADTYLAGFAYRFNRRFDLRSLVARLIVDTARCSPRRISEIRGGAEAHY